MSKARQNIAKRFARETDPAKRERLAARMQRKTRQRLGVGKDK